MDVGLLDRRLKILRRINAKEGTYGTKTTTWSELAAVWAKIEEVMPPRGDRLDDKLIITVRQAKVRIRWRGDISQANRVELDGQPMRITAGPAMVGRQQWLDFMIEQLSTEGEQP